MNYKIIGILSILLTGCSTGFKHENAEIINFDFGLGSIKDEKELASYHVTSLEKYSLLKQNKILERVRMGDAQYLRNCKGDQWNISFSQTLIYNRNNVIFIGYPSKYECEIVKDEVEKYLIKKETLLLKQQEIKANQIQSEKKYKASKEFADRVFEQNGYDRALALTCLKYGLATQQAVLQYVNNAEQYAKDLTGKNYNNDLMQSALEQGFMLINEGKLSVSPNYCKAIDFGGAAYKRF